MREEADRPERCETCRFWVRNSDKESYDGECHRHPPKIVSAIVHLLVNSSDDIHQREHADRMDDASFTEEVFRVACSDTAVLFPSIHMGEWCGEWQHQPGGASS